MAQKEKETAEPPTRYQEGSVILTVAPGPFTPMNYTTWALSDNHKLLSQKGDLLAAYYSIILVLGIDHNDLTFDCISKSSLQYI